MNLLQKLINREAGADLPSLSEKEALVLRLLIAHGERYGLELVDLSDGQIRPGTLYVTLGRMIEKGFLEARKIPPPPGQGGLPRRVYWPSANGVRVLRAHDRLEAMLLTPVRGEVGG